MTRLPPDGAALRRHALRYPEAPFASLTEYRLGWSRWVTAGFARGSRIPNHLLELWIDESYRAVARTSKGAARRSRKRASGG